MPMGGLMPSRPRQLSCMQLNCLFERRNIKADSRVLAVPTVSC